MNKNTTPQKSSNLPHIEQDSKDVVPKAISAEVHVPKLEDVIVTPKKVRTFSIDHAERLPSSTFPNQPSHPASALPNTIPNVNHLMKGYGITVRYNVIRKKLLVTLPGYSGTQENADNVALTQVESLAALNNIPTGKIPSYIAAISDSNQYNPVADWIMSKPWDKKDRLPEIYNTLVANEEFPIQLKEVIIRRWLLSAVAAALKPSGFHCRGVLTLQGPQSIGKTSWINALVSDPLLRDEVIKLDHHLDAGSKDSVLTAVSHWIVEFGEVDSTFKKDNARLKSFITAPNDKHRRPYAKVDSEYQRRTVFCASVNDANFLVDTTGNSRWWTIPVIRIEFQHQVDMQQVFAQLAVDYEKGEQWWLTPEEEAELEAQNINHRMVSAVYERLLDAIDIDRAREDNLPAMTPIEVLHWIGIKNPTNIQCKECAAFLREHFDDSKRNRGRDTWRVPMKNESFDYLPHAPAKSVPAPENDDDLY